jgi:PTH1 family peptidyl-tRNA hydrolase
MWLLAGLGNPGAAYAANRHNIGFMLLDFLAKAEGWDAGRKKLNSLVAQGAVGEGARRHEVVAIKPQTFMNLSGMAVGAALHFYKLPLERLLVVHDDIDLPFGSLRLKLGGGHGGHNGLRHISAQLGSQYWRLRMGVGRPLDKAQVHDFVLGNFAAAETEALPGLFATAHRAIPWLLDGKPDYARNLLSPPRAFPI